MRGMLTLETHSREIADEMRDFLGRHIA